jgi:hypothetical protein
VAAAGQIAATPSRALTARQASLPYDQDRIRLFRQLADSLPLSAPQNRPVSDPRDPRDEYLPFFEAYFSNFIEGTEFELDEAVAVVYEGKQVPGRADDTYDLVGTYMVVADLAGMTTLAATPQEFLDLLRSRHATIMGGRPDKRPGVFKEAANRAGDSLFVLPGSTSQASLAPPRCSTRPTLSTSLAAANDSGCRMHRTRTRPRSVLLCHAPWAVAAFADIHPDLRK